LRAAGHHRVTRCCGPSGEPDELLQGRDVDEPQVLDVEVHGLVFGQLNRRERGSEFGGRCNVHFTQEKDPDTRGVSEGLDVQPGVR
jgi:hypothetical protein